MAASLHHLSHEITKLPALPALLVGAVLLLLGRKLFWLFVGAAGFFFGMEAAATALPHQPDAALIAGLILGLICAVIAILVQKVAIGIAGFLSGGYFLMVALRAWEIQTPGSEWIAFLIGGIIGAVLMYAVFNWALIILSSISGAHLIVQPLALTHEMATAAFVVLVVVGILVQGRLLSSPRAQDT